MILNKNKLTLFANEYSLFGDLLYDSKGYLNKDIILVEDNLDTDVITIFFKNESLAIEYWQVFCSLKKEFNIL